jgi:putative copper export protein
MNEIIKRFSRAAVVIIGVLIGCGAIAMVCMIAVNWNK